jgi:hypothetical protein
MRPRCLRCSSLKILSVTFGVIGRRALAAGRLAALGAYRIYERQHLDEHAAKMRRPGVNGGSSPGETEQLPGFSRSRRSADEPPIAGAIRPARPSITDTVSWNRLMSLF